MTGSLAHRATKQSERPWQAIFTLSGRWLKRVADGRALPSAGVLRWFNHVPSLLLLAVIWLMLAKPI